MRAKFVHIADAHLDDGTASVVGNVDIKVPIRGAKNSTRNQAMERTLERVAQRLTEKGISSIDALIVSGDASDRGNAAGHSALLAMILDTFGPFGVKAGNIVAVPGNHDVQRGSLPDSDARYQNFLRTWRDAGCVTPWLKDLEPAGGAPHYLLAADGSWLIVPMNTSNWSQTERELEEPLKSVWSQLHISDVVPRRDQDRVKKQLEDLIAYDITRVGGEELDYLQRNLSIWTRGKSDPILRIGVLHHHLLSPGVREELRPFADPTNLTQIRSFLGQQRFDLILHGHKHESAAYYDHFRPDGGVDSRRALIVSGGSVATDDGADAVRLIEIDGLPFAPSTTVEAFTVPVLGMDTKVVQVGPLDLWASESDTPGQPVVIHGTNIDTVYQRAQVIARRAPRPSALIVHLDLPHNGDELPIPSTYKLRGIDSDETRTRWLTELVNWWQEAQSRLQHRIPQAHGARLRKFGGKINQIDRIGRLLKNGQTTKAVAVLIDPFIDFDDEARFASFCLVQFTRRKVNHGEDYVDCIAYYRAQEFAQWWPINVAELRMMQLDIAKHFSGRPGRITTIAADPRHESLSPTEAIVPVIDRWVDRNPERIFLLANALLAGEAVGETQIDVVREWRRLLADLLSTTERFNPDGMPTAVDGLRALGTFLSANGAPHMDIKSMAQTLHLLADTNRTWEKSKRESEDFDGWRSQAKAHLEKLIDLSERRLNTSGGA